MTGTPTLAAMSEPRRAILLALKGSGELALADIAERLGVSYEATRQQVAQLESEGWVGRRTERAAPSPGRPRSLFRLTAAGEHLFPKEYDELAVTLIDAVHERLGPQALAELLEEVVRRKVLQWEPLLEGLDLVERLEALRGIYTSDDPFCRVETNGGGTPRLVEMNCPYLEVAQRRPALCSITVSVLRRLLAHEVVRTERFQNGDGRCVFQVLAAQPVAADAPLFRFE